MDIKETKKELKSYAKLVLRSIRLLENINELEEKVQSASSRREELMICRMAVGKKQILATT